MIPLLIIVAYLVVLLLLGVFAGRFFRGTGKDYMLASHSIGPFLLLMSLFGTTMTAFALVGSTGAAYGRGVIVYGLMASGSGIIHSLCFFLLGPKLSSFGKRHGYTTQIEFFRARLDNDAVGLLLFPILVGLVVPYLLIGVMSAGVVINGVSKGVMPDGGGLPTWLGSMAICIVVLFYVFFGGMRATAWANTFQTLVFIILGVVTFLIITQRLGGIGEATGAVMASHPEKLNPAQTTAARWEFMAYLLIPLSVGMFPHVFQHWLTAKNSSTFKLPIVAHPLLILIVWAPCVLVGTWATSVQVDGSLVVPEKTPSNEVLISMVAALTSDQLMGLLTAGILAAIMSSLDSQFLCLGSIFTKDVVQRVWRNKQFSDSQTVWLARGFVVVVVLITWLLSLVATKSVFGLGVWCFTGFTGLFPLIFAALYWRRLTVAGAYAAVIAVVATWVPLFCNSGFGDPRYKFHGVMPIVIVTAASTLAMVIVSLVTKQPSDATLAKFFRR